jgi:flagellar protein FlgJ
VTAAISTTNDFQGLARLKGQAAGRDPEATREAARQFEALFVQMMLESMRDANAVLGGGQDTTYQEMFDKQIALEITRGKGLGMGELMAQQLGALDAAVAGDGGSEPAAIAQSLPMLLSRLPPASRAIVPELQGLPGIDALDTAIDAQAAPDVSALQATDSGDHRPTGREAFVREVWPLAVAAGEELDVNPRAIVAQAALETGWGSRLIRNGNGASANNLFGIKADSSWGGPRASVLTLEYEGGLPKPQRAQFRAYPDLASGFQDYVRFLKSNPRYREALRAGQSTEVYAERLQSAGYATDPRYAEKISRIAGSPLISATSLALKSGSDVPSWY